VCTQSWRLPHPAPVVFFQFDPNPHPYPQYGPAIAVARVRSLFRSHGVPLSLPLRSDLVLMSLATDGVIRFWRQSSPQPLPVYPTTNASLHWFIGHEMQMHGLGNDYVGAAWLSYFERRYEPLATAKHSDSAGRLLTVNRKGHVTLWYPSTRHAAHHACYNSPTSVRAGTSNICMSGRAPIRSRSQW
jgi:hypothetical protein